MKYAIISDIHANPSALEKVLSDAERYGAEKVVCAGCTGCPGKAGIESTTVFGERNNILVETRAF